MDNNEKLNECYGECLSIQIINGNKVITSSFVSNADIDEDIEIGTSIDMTLSFDSSDLYEIFVNGDIFSVKISIKKHVLTHNSFIPNDKSCVRTFDNMKIVRYRYSCNKTNVNTIDLTMRKVA